MKASKVKSELRKLGTKERANSLMRFFKTGKGQYGEGDQFLGLTTPQIRLIVKKHNALPLPQIASLLASKYHEERVTALAILTIQYERSENKKELYDFYLKNTKYINNWDLVDISAPKIVGAYLLDKNSSILHKLAKSNNLWERRIAIVATFAFIKNGQLGKTLEIARVLLADKEDLIHKAVGWMLREVGKKDQKLLESFLKENIEALPRTSLRYAIERFPKEKRASFLAM